jgi:hypothetical protein
MEEDRPQRDRADVVIPLNVDAAIKVAAFRPVLKILKDEGKGATILS